MCEPEATSSSDHFTSSKTAAREVSLRCASVWTPFFTVLAISSRPLASCAGCSDANGVIGEKNVGKTMPFLPSPSHHHFYRWYNPFPNEGCMIVLPPWRFNEQT